MDLKPIQTQGITCLEPLSADWYWGMDYTHGDLYEAEELFRDGHPVHHNTLVLVRYPDGTVHRPPAQDGQYWGRPIFCEGEIILLRADFPAEKVEVLQYDPEREALSVLTALSLSELDDCYNLMLKDTPLMLTRQGTEGQFQLLWPQRVSFPIGPTEVFLCRRGETLYFSAWYEDPDYREEVILRKPDTGEILKRFPGSLMSLPDGQLWHLT